MIGKSCWPEDYISKLVIKHENRVYRTAISIMKNRADAEDIVQDVFIKVMQKAPNFESDEHESAWLIRVTINMCRSRLRTAWLRRTEPLIDTYPAQTKEQLNLIEHVMALPTKYRIVVNLFYYEGYSTKEISYITNQKESTVRSLLTRARQKLKYVLKEDEL
jgi:RNA polymerase sigma-70 factor (ECF subfamily)